MKKAILIDTSKCIGCRACQAACKQWNQLPAEETTFNGNYENPPQLSPDTWMRITFKEAEENGKLDWYFGNNRCMHCTDAACMIVCPVGAIYRTETGSVAINNDKCIGCNYCVANCPFQAMSFDRQSNHPVKCTMCIDRTANDFIPACAKACPTGAIEYGDRTALVNKATKKVAELKAKGKSKARVYGLEEVSGTGTMFVLQNDPEYYGLPADPYVPVKARVGVLFSSLLGCW
jgi:formate dehydrogenase iron-sulfur subunit